ncbi:carotenoid oxygenase family protein [Vulgatibacter sp.]|uniref:carotenoid oxygenase family protein n=1 Tax=Vulgatibacter sp. TaxID=1971226 RepID=UPI00356A0CD4
MQATAPHLAARTAADWRRAFQDLPREHGFEPLRIEGRLPPELRGTLYRNGPALFSSHGERYRHWFDGDGAVSAVRLAGDGAARGAVRLVMSEGLVEERLAGHRIFEGYGTVAAGGPIARLRHRTKNAANTSVFAWNGALYALFEGGKPTQIDPDDLLTIGTTDFGGVIPATFSAHPHRVPARRASYNFGLRFGRQTLLDLFALPDGGPASRIASLPLRAPTMIHDFIATEHHLVFFVSPLRLQVLRQLLGLGAYGDNLAWRPDAGTEVLVVPIDDPGHAIRFEAEPFFQFHFANAFERDGAIVVDLVRYPDFTINDWLGGLPHGEERPVRLGSFARATLDLRARTLRSETRWDRTCEFPRVAPATTARDYRFAWLASHAGSAAGLFDTITRLDVQSGEARSADLGSRCYPSEPVFVQRPGATAEEDGWALTLVYDAAAHRTHLAVLDGRTLEVEARAHFDHHLPPSFHGGFAPLP